MNTTMTSNRNAYTPRAPRPAVPQPPPSLGEQAEDALLALAPYVAGALALGLAVAGALAVVALQPAWLSALIVSLEGVQPKVFWYLSRSSAIVGYLMLWASMVTGLAITNKMARAWPGGPTYNALHEHTSWLGMLFGMFHAFILIFDGYIGYTLNQILVPFASTGYRPIWVAFGQIALYLFILVTLSVYARKWIGYRAWRVIHYLSFAVFLLALVHGLFSGTDSTGLPMLVVYWASFVSVLSLLGYRIAEARARTLAKKPASA
jgi:predicted ferric reductase